MHMLLKHSTCSFGTRMRHWFVVWMQRHSFVLYPFLEVVVLSSLPLLQLTVTH